MGSVRGRKKAAVALADGRGLPTDVLFEVLLRFPANVLCRLRLVCRSWRSLTLDPIFARAHASRHPLVTAIHFSRVSHEVRVVDLHGNIVKRMPLAQPNYAMTTQLDMVCVTGSLQRSGSVLDLAAGKVVTTLSLRDDVHGTSEVISLFLLGHVPSTGEYKVFYSEARAVTVHGEEGFHAVQVCSITTLGDSGDGGRWREKPSPPALIASSPRDRVVVVGVAYFLSMRCTGNNVEPDAIAVFDLASEEWRPETLQGPLSSRFAGGNQKLVYEEHRNKIQLAAIDDCLVTIHHNHRQSMDLWFLVDKELWNKRYSIQSATHCSLWTSFPLLLLDDGRIVIWEERVHVLRVYDPRTNKWVDLATLEEYYLFMNLYQGNLLCPGLQR